MTMVTDGNKKNGNENSKRNVEIKIDDATYSVHRGHQTVEALKAVAGIPLAYDFNQVIDGEFIPLPDDGGVTLKGGEVFISHPKDGSSS